MTEGNYDIHENYGASNLHGAGGIVCYSFFISIAKLIKYKTETSYSLQVFRFSLFGFLGNIFPVWPSH